MARAGRSGAHPGFKAVQSQIAQTVKPRAGETAEEAAGAILASRTRGASAAAKRRNPRLNRVKGSNPGKKRKAKSNPMSTNISHMFKGY